MTGEPLAPPRRERGPGGYRPGLPDRPFHVESLLLRLSLAVRVPALPWLDLDPVDHVGRHLAAAAAPRRPPT